MPKQPKQKIVASEKETLGQHLARIRKECGLTVKRKGLFLAYQYMFHCCGSTSFCFMIMSGSGVVKRPISDPK
jgi:hypothetical protein